MEETEERRLEKRYLLLKKRLEILNYTDGFAKDSVDLVEKLLKDLIDITESFRAIRDVLQDTQVNLDKASAERDILKTSIHEFEDTSKHIHADLKVIKQERDDLTAQVEQLVPLVELNEGNVKRKDEEIAKYKQVQTLNCLITYIINSCSPP